ncbi:MAG: OmpH family outer membrane protein [bacterium]|nr:OmpH family outer membrane protein [bacterium]
MKKLLLFGLLLFSGASVFAQEDIAIVDLSKIVENSAQVRQLKQEHSKKIADLDKILVNARGEISNEKDPAKVLLLEDKYMKEFNSKREVLEKDYNGKISVIEKNIKDEITKKAQKDGYKYVFAKSVVLYGGKDITSELLNSIK